MEGLSCFTFLTLETEACAKLLSEKYGIGFNLLLAVMILSISSIFLGSILGKKTYKLFRIKPGVFVGYGTVIFFCSFILFVILVGLTSIL